MFAIPGEFEVVLATTSWLGHRFHARLAAGAQTDAAEAPARPAVRLPDGHVLDPTRSRWDGPLDAEELAYCRTHGIPLAYDCAQVGWVTLDCTDDDPPLTPAPPGSGREAASHGVRGLDPLAQPAEGLDIRRACAAIRVRAQRLARASGWTDEQHTAAADALAQAIAAEVREFAASHGLRAANGLHWALQSIVHRERTPPASEAGGLAAAGEFTFRPWTPADVPVYRRMLENPRMWEFMPEQLPIPLTDEATRALIEMGSVAGHQEALAVEHTLPPTRSGAGVPVGQCLLRFDEPFEGIRAAEVAYWLDEEHWGKGWMTRILPAFVARGMRMHDVDVVYAWIREDHAASRRVAERAGFERDTFVLEEELAEATRRPGFVRYATYRPAWVPLPFR